MSKNDEYNVIKNIKKKGKYHNNNNNNNKNKNKNK